MVDPNAIEIAGLIILGWSDAWLMVQEGIVSRAALSAIQQRAAESERKASKAALQTEKVASTTES